MTALTTDLSGKVALVTGASRGIGYAIALALANAGADVAVASRHEPESERVAGEIRNIGRRAVAVAADLCDVSQIAPMVQCVEQELGPIDILVNNAGTNQVEPSVEVTLDTWDRLLDVNLRAPFFCATTVAKGMLERRRGKIINIASEAGINGLPEHAAYGTSKAGLLMLTRILAVEWGSRNIQVNAISPGPTWTDMTGPAMDIPEIRDKLLARGVAGRICNPEEVGTAAVFLASDAANMIMGQSINIDGGSTAK